ncbi:hypothetical protein BBP40_001236 [Aspergillus hancockii]|nr:hypothetical protein BBP40_001236 [Aspergillus hancockii]
MNSGPAAVEVWEWEEAIMDIMEEAWVWEVLEEVIMDTTEEEWVWEVWEAGPDLVVQAEGITVEEGSVAMGVATMAVVGLVVDLEDLGVEDPAVPEDGDKLMMLG